MRRGAGRDTPDAPARSTLLALAGASVAAALLASACASTLASKPRLSVQPTVLAQPKTEVSRFRSPGDPAGTARGFRYRVSGSDVTSAGLRLFSGASVVRFGQSGGDLVEITGSAEDALPFLENVSAWEDIPSYYMFHSGGDDERDPWMLDGVGGVRTSVRLKSGPKWDLDVSGRSLDMRLERIRVSQLDLNAEGNVKLRISRETLAGAGPGTQPRLDVQAELPGEGILEVMAPPEVGVLIYLDRDRPVAGARKVKGEWLARGTGPGLIEISLYRDIDSKGRPRARVTRTR